MEMLVCEKCGSHDFLERNGRRVCSYCRTEYAMPRGECASSDIDLQDDVSRLLEQCELYPENARRCASLILDIDPDNKEALKYL